VERKATSSRHEASSERYCYHAGLHLAFSSSQEVADQSDDYQEMYETTTEDVEDWVVYSIHSALVPETEQVD